MFKFSDIPGLFGSIEKSITDSIDAMQATWGEVLKAFGADLSTQLGTLRQAVADLKAQVMANDAALAQVAEKLSTLGAVVGPSKPQPVFFTRYERNANMQGTLVLSLPEQPHDNSGSIAALDLVLKKGDKEVFSGSVLADSPAHGSGSRGAKSIDADLDFGDTLDYTLTATDAAGLSSKTEGQIVLTDNVAPDAPGAVNATFAAKVN